MRRSLVGAARWSARFVYLYQTIDDPRTRTRTSRPRRPSSTTPTARPSSGSSPTQNRDSIPLGEMPQTLQDAVVAAENRTFWTDSGIDPKGIIRAAFSNARGNATQGASTITQQYVKILYLSQERSLKRKVKEAILSLKIQQQRASARSSRATSTPSTSAAAPTASRRPRRRTSTWTPRTSTLRAVRRAGQRPQQPRRGFDPANGKDARAGAQGALRLRAPQHGRAWATSPPAQAEKAAKRLPKFPKIEAAEPVRRPAGHMLDDGQATSCTASATPTRRSTAAACGSPPPSPRRRWRRPSRACSEARPDGFGDKSCTSPWPASSPAPARCAASTAARTTSSPRSTGPRPAARRARRSSRSRSRPALEGRLLAQGHLRRQLALLLPRRHRRCATRAARRRQRLRLGGQPDHGDRGVDQHRLRRPDRRRSPTARRRSSRPPTRSASRQRTRSTRASSTPARTSSRSPIALGIGHGQPDQHGQRLRDASPTAASAPTCT